jgi:hypothetical protein
MKLMKDMKSMKKDSEFFFMTFTLFMSFMSFFLGLPSGHMLLTSGTRLGSYEVIDTLGAGGMSACGPRAERGREPRRAHALGVGPQRS